MRAIFVIFFVTGFSFGTWLSRLPSLRDALGATTVEMSFYGLCLAAGSIVGILLSGRLIERFGPRRMITITVALQVVALPGAAALFVAGHLLPGLAVLFLFGSSFSTTDISMNVSGAGAERAEGRPRMPLMHGFYSIGMVASLSLGALAELLRLTLTAHFLLAVAVIAVASFAVIRMIPSDESRFTIDEDHPTLDASGLVPVIESSSDSLLLSATDSVPIIPAHVAEAARLGGAHAVADARGAEGVGTGTNTAAAAGPGSTKGRYTPWTDKRVLLIGLITVSAGLLEGVPADWLPLALVDGRGVSNEIGALMLGVFFVAVVAARLAGSALLTRFGRVAVVRGSLTVAATGVLVITLFDGPAAMVVGTIAWGLGTGVSWPVTISASADRPKTAARDVAAVSAIGYASMLIGPMVFGVLGEQFGLLRSFWVLFAFVVLAFALASVLRQPEAPRAER